MTPRWPAAAAAAVPWRYPGGGPCRPAAAPAAGHPWPPWHLSSRPGPCAAGLWRRPGPPGAHPRRRHSPAGNNAGVSGARPSAGAIRCNQALALSPRAGQDWTGRAAADSGCIALAQGFFWGLGAAAAAATGAGSAGLAESSSSLPAAASGLVVGSCFGAADSSFAASFFGAAGAAAPSTPPDACFLPSYGDRRRGDSAECYGNDTRVGRGPDLGPALGPWLAGVMGGRLWPIPPLAALLVALLLVMLPHDGAPSLEWLRLVHERVKSYTEGRLNDVPMEKRAKAHLYLLLWYYGHRFPYLVKCTLLSCRKRCTSAPGSPCRANRMERQGWRRWHMRRLAKGADAQPPAMEQIFMHAAGEASPLCRGLPCCPPKTSVLATSASASRVDVSGRERRVGNGSTVLQWIKKHGSDPRKRLQHGYRLHYGGMGVGRMNLCVREIKQGKASLN